MLKLFLLFILSAGIHASQFSALKIGVDRWPPYEYVLGEKPNGIAYEITKSVLKNIHWPIRSVEEYPWKRAQSMVYQGELDLLLSASPSKKRKENCWLSEEPLLLSQWVIMVREDRSKNELHYKNYDSTKGYTVGLVRGYAYTETFWNDVDRLANTDIVHDEMTNFRKLKIGRIDYLATELAVGLSMAKQVPVEVHAFTENPIKSTGLFPLFSKKTVSEKEVKTFNEELKRFKKTSDYQAILSKYNLKHQSPEDGGD